MKEMEELEYRSFGKSLVAGLLVSGAMVWEPPRESLKTKHKIKWTELGVDPVSTWNYEHYARI